MSRQRKNEESALLPIPNHQRYQSKTHIFFISWAFALSSLYFGYIQVYLGAINISTIIQVYNVTIDRSLAQGLLNGCIPFGAIFGSLSIQFLLSKLSRRKSLLFVNLVAFIVGLLIYIPNFYSLIVFRLIQGICTGLYSGLPSLIIKELVPVQISGTMGTFTQLNLTSGIILGYFFTYLLKKITGDYTGEAFWLIIFGFPLVTIAIQSFILIYVFPFETPKYLLMQNKQEEAEELIKMIYKAEYVGQVLQQKYLDIQKINNSKKEESQSMLEQFEPQRPIINKRLAIIMSFHVAIFQQLSGVSVLNVYCGPIVQKIAQGELKLLIPTLLISVKLMGTVVTSNVISRLGRKTIFQIGLILLAVGNASISFGFLFNARQPDSTISTVLIIFGMFFYLAIFGFTAGPVAWIYMSQIVQPKNFSNSVAVLWLFSALMIILFPVIQEKVLEGDPFILFLFFGVWCLFSFVINHFLMVETKNKTQRQIQEEYQNVKIC